MIASLPVRNVFRPKFSRVIDCHQPHRIISKGPKVFLKWLQDHFFQTQGVAENTIF